ncbi:meiotic recombination, partial [Coemansia asiatica]
MSDDRSTLSILVATDNHLGYLERDPIRGQDSFDAFSEILQLAQAYKVDMVLLGGDLFHDNKPSRKSLHQALSLFRKYCLGNKPVSVEYLSDPLVDFGSDFSNVNYEDPNINISLPVFSIHGNHDDPSGHGNLSAMDMLAVSGLVNYFGKQTEVENIRVSPVLLRKGDTRLALYGLGNIRDERLHRTIARKHMTMCQPSEDTDRWFNLMVLHQNRAAHGPKNHIPEHFLSEFLDLVIWGHEHQCLVDPEYNHQRAFYVSQPGSSIATSLSPGEAVAKHVALVKVNRRNFKIDKLRLKNVRPFVIEDVVLSQVQGLSPQSTEAEIVEYLRGRVEKLIAHAQAIYNEQLERGSEIIEPALGAQPKPLVRVRVDYTGGFESFHPQRFGLLFADRVANPRDIVYFFRKTRSSSANNLDKRAALSGAFQNESAVPEPVDAVHVENLIGEFLDDTSMHMLVDLELADAVRLFVQKGDADAIAQSLRTTIGDTQKIIIEQSLRELDITEKKLDEHIAKTRSIRRTKAVEDGKGLILSAVADTQSSKGSNDASNVSSMSLSKASSAVDQKKPNPENAGYNYSDSSDSSSHDDQEDDDDFRQAGEDLNVSKGRKTAAANRSAKPAKTVLTLAKSRPKAGSKRTAAAAVADKDSDDSDASLSTKMRPPALVARPSRNARSTLSAKQSNGSAKSDSARLSGSEAIASDSEDSVAPTPVAARKRLKTSTKAAAAAAVPAARATATRRGRGGRGGSTKSLRSSVQQSSTSNSSQLPVVNIDDDDDDEDEDNANNDEASLEPTNKAISANGIAKWYLDETNI